MRSPTDSVAPQFHPTLPRTALDAEKRVLRLAARDRRNRLLPADAAQRLQRHVLALLAGAPLPGCVGAYWPIGSELDVRPAMYALAERGVRLALPQTGTRGTALRFRAWRIGGALLPGPFGTVRSDGAEVKPDLLLVPLLAFDRRGNRLGYGGGYYDRTLAADPKLVAVGCAYAAQELDAVPVGQHDVKLSLIATEIGVVRT